MDLTKEQWKAFIRHALEQVEKLEAAKAEEKPKTWPQIGDQYWSVNHYGDLFTAGWQGTIREKDALRLGFIFKSKTEAERRAEALKVQAELRAMPGRCGPPDGELAIWAVRLRRHGGFQPDYYSTEGVAQIALAGVWFESEEAAQHAINTIGQDRLRLWLDDYLQVPVEGGAL